MFLETRQEALLHIVVIYIVEEMNSISQTHISKFKLYANDMLRSSEIPGCTREYRGRQQQRLMC